jgi:hypothetical protein
MPARKTRKVSKKLLVEETSVWNKNKPLEAFWQSLASGKKVVVIYKDGKHKFVNMPSAKTKSKAQYDEFDADPDVAAVLSSNQSQDAYEMHLFPKAGDKSVPEVIKNYKRYFKSIGPMPIDMLASGFPAMRKVKVPA